MTDTVQNDASRIRIGLVADSHGNVDYLMLAGERLMGQHHVDRIFHLGGGSRDVEEVINFKKKMMRGTEEYGDDAFLSDVADFLKASSGGGGDELAEYRKKWTVVHDEGVGGTVEKIVDMIGSHIALALHDPATLDAEDLANASLILHGRMERAGVVEKKKRWFLCPGHLRDKEHEGRPASFGVLEIAPKATKLSIYGVGGELLQEFPIVLEKKGKMTVK